MKAYRPYETFGTIDKERHFDTIDELVEYYTPWCKEHAIQLECTALGDDHAVFLGTNMYHLEDLKDDGVDEIKAMEQSMECLIIDNCTEEEISELETTTIG